MEKIIEIFTLLTGVIYVILEIRQKNLMWVLGIFTSLASMWMFYHNGMYASFGLQIYYFVTAFIGLWQWRRDRGDLTVEQQKQDSSICMRRLPLRTALVSVLLIVAGTFVLSWAMDRLHALGMLAENPMSLLDASIATISMVATWWLVRSYLQQWWLWIVANVLTIALCCIGQMWWMAALYVAYVAASVIGLRYWRKNGVYLES